MLDWSGVASRSCDPCVQVIVQDQNKKIFLMCKGADSKIFERLHPDSQALMKTTLEHLAVCCIAVPYNVCSIDDTAAVSLLYSHIQLLSIFAKQKF